MDLKNLGVAFATAFTVAACATPTTPEAQAERDKARQEAQERGQQIGARVPETLRNNLMRTPRALAGGPLGQGASDTVKAWRPPIVDEIIGIFRKKPKPEAPAAGQ